MKQISSLHQIFIAKLQSLYDTERELLKALPKMVKKATDPELREALINHLKESNEHVLTLERCFILLGESLKKIKSGAIRGLVTDTEWVMKSISDKYVLDAGLIAALQYIQHYKMAGYRAALGWASEMKHREVQDFLSRALADERSADDKLMDIALAKVNERAYEEGL